MSRGTICFSMIQNESRKGKLPCVPKKEKMTGEVIATAILLNKLYVARQAISPPSIPVITAAAVAVGQIMQINVPCATRGSRKYSIPYTIRLPNICIPNSHACNGDMFMLRSDNLQ